MKRTSLIGSVGAAALTAALIVRADAAVDACLVGSAPEVAVDVGDIASLREQVAMQCVCAEYDGSTSSRGHGAYVRCARRIIRAAAEAGDLRRRCRSTATRFYAASTCGYERASSPALSVRPCIEQRLSSGVVRCSIKPESRCVSVAGSVSRVPCTAVEACVDAADDNGNFVFNDDPTGGDDGACAHTDPIVRFVAVGDTGRGDAGQLAVAQAIESKCAASGCDFVQLLGDNIYPSGVTSTGDPQWQTKFETPYAALTLPFYAVLGNHDYGGDGAGNEFGKAQNEIDYTAVSAKWKMPAAYFSRTWRHVDLFALDTNAQVYEMDTAQQADVGTWLAASAATWRIAFGHHPYLSNGPHGNAGSYDGVPGAGTGVKEFMEGVVCGLADVYFSGHDHTLQWLTPTCAGTELVVSGTGAAATSLPGVNATHFESLAVGFAYVVADGGTLTVEMIDSTGATLFTRALTKP